MKKENYVASSATHRRGGENIEIIPAILPKDFDELERKLALLKDVSVILGEQKKMVVQMDICDGLFVETKTWPYWEGDVLEKLAPFRDVFDFEIDLFVQNPKSAISNWQEIGAKRIILHIESLIDQSLSELFIELDVQATQFGFSLNLETATKGLDQYVRDADFFQFMGINKIGHQGEKFNKGVLKKIKIFRQNNPDVIISVDGGVNLKNSQDLVKMGANRLVVGSVIFGKHNAEEIVQIIKKFRKIHPVK